MGAGLAFLPDPLAVPKSLVVFNNRMMDAQTMVFIRHSVETDTRFSFEWMTYLVHSILKMVTQQFCVFRDSSKSKKFATNKQHFCGKLLWIVFVKLIQSKCFFVFLFCNSTSLYANTKVLQRRKVSHKLNNLNCIKSFRSPRFFSISSDIIWLLLTQSPQYKRNR